MLRRLRYLAGQPVAHNAAFLMLVQAATLLVPFLTLPWVLRALQPAAFGRFAFYQSIAQYFIILVEFGFYLTATKRIAELRWDTVRRTQYFWTVQAAKTMIAAVVGAILAVVLLIVPLPPGDRLLMIASLATIIGTVLTPMWLFAGMERMGFISTSVIISRVAMVPVTLWLVRSPTDAWIAAAIVSAGNVLAGVIALLLVWQSRLVTRWYLPCWSEVLASYRDAWHLFLSNGATSLYAAANPVLLATVSSSTQVGLFGAADRIRQISLGIVPPISNAFYPHISRTMASDRAAGLRLARRLLTLFVGLTAAVSLVLFAVAPMVVDVIMGPGYEGSILVLRILAAVPLLVGVSTCLGTLTMLPLGLTRQYSRILLWCGLGNLCLLPSLGTTFGAVGAAISLVMTELAVAISMLATVMLHGFRLGGRS